MQCTIDKILFFQTLTNAILFLVKMEALALMASTYIRVTAFPVIPELIAKQVSLPSVEVEICTVIICGLDIGECVSVPCQNNGTCVDEINRFTCICANGFSGNVCETSEILAEAVITFSSSLTTDIDECVSVPCKNGGTCVDGIDDYICFCMPGYTGDSCETS